MFNVDMPPVMRACGIPDVRNGSNAGRKSSTCHAAGLIIQFGHFQATKIRLYGAIDRYLKSEPRFACTEV